LKIIHPPFSQVAATAVLAYPAARQSQGKFWTENQLKMCLALNILLQVVASLAGHLFATWFGPVSVVGPIFFAVELMANVIVFGIALGLEHFSKEMKVGTYVIVVGTILLLRVGPGTIELQDFVRLVTRPWALAWCAVLLFGMLLSTVIMNFRGFKTFNIQMRTSCLLVARGSTFALNLSAGKALVLETSTPWKVVAVLIKVLSGAVYTQAIVVQSTTVEQRVFVPLVSVFIMSVNAITGLVIWEDWTVVQDWTGYACVFLLFFLGCYLMLGDITLLGEAFGGLFRTTYRMFLPSSRDDLLVHLKAFFVPPDESALSVVSGETSELTRSQSTKLRNEKSWTNIFEIHSFIQGQGNQFKNTMSTMMESTLPIQSRGITGGSIELVDGGLESQPIVGTPVSSQERTITIGRAHSPRERIGL